MAPKRSKAWREGYDAYNDDEDRDANPYEVDDDKSTQWLDGWSEAQIIDSGVDDDDDDEGE